VSATPKQGGLRALAARRCALRTLPAAIAHRMQALTWPQDFVALARNLRDNARAGDRGRCAIAPVSSFRGGRLA